MTRAFLNLCELQIIKSGHTKEKSLTPFLTSYELRTP